MSVKKFKFVVRAVEEILVTESYILGDLMDYVNVLSEYSADEILHELQFTGLLDKNSVEIYEGDIIEHRDGYPRNYKNYKVVKFEDGEFTNCYSYDTGGATTAHPFVIGNIYENPELLESK